jgi:hypothetical protein
MDLRLDDDGSASEPRGDRHGFVSRDDHFTERDRNAVPGKDRLGLIFVNFHVVGSVAPEDQEP